MFFRRVALHIIVWLGVFVFWLVATRQYHPTLSIALSATAVLVSVSAVAVYVNSVFLLPRFASRRLWLSYAASLLGTIIVLDLIAVPLIQFIYDLLWKPDPLRFGFWFNFLSDGFIIFLHIAIAMLLDWLIKFVRKSSPPQMRAF